MGSVAKRSCEMGKRCTQFPSLGEASKLDRYNKSGICRPCQDAGYRPGDSKLLGQKTSLERRYSELLRASQVLLEREASETEVVPTLVFAALIPAVPYLENIRDQFVAAGGPGKDAWSVLRTRFYNTFTPLEAKDVDGGVVVVGHSSIRPTVVFGEEPGLVEGIVIEVDDPTADPKMAAAVYEQALALVDVPCSDSTTGQVGWELRPGAIHIAVRPVSQDTHPIFGRAALPLEKQRQFPFPHPDLVEDMCGALKRAFRNKLPGRKSGGSFHKANLIAACVAWYLGARGKIKRTNRLEPVVAALLNENLLAEQLPETGWITGKGKSIGDRLPKVDKPIRDVEEIFRGRPAVSSRFSDLYF